MEEQEKYPKGHFVGLWTAIGIAIFSGVGVPLSLATGNLGLIGIGPAIGVGFGFGIGTAIEKKKAEEGLIRPLTEAEEKRQKTTSTVLKALVVLGIIVAVGIFFIAK